MRFSKLIAVASLVGSSLFLGAAPASACEGICTPPVASSCLEVSSGGAGVGPGTQVRVYQHDVELHSIGDCI
jgi:hypothetical protein